MMISAGVLPEPPPPRLRGEVSRGSASGGGGVGRPIPKSSSPQPQTCALSPTPPPDLTTTLNSPIARLPRHPRRTLPRPPLRWTAPAVLLLLLAAQALCLQWSYSWFGNRRFETAATPSPSYYPCFSLSNGAIELSNRATYLGWVPRETQGWQPADPRWGWCWVPKCRVRWPYPMLLVPLWMPSALAAALTAAAWWPHARAWHRQRKGQCIRCCYDLTGNATGVCPECGEPILPPSAPHPHSSSHRIAQPGRAGLQ
jgi:hypothetical protein